MLVRVYFGNINNHGFYEYGNINVKLTNAKYYCMLCKLYKYNYSVLQCCNYVICSNCIDILYDSYVLDDYTNELFKCVNCLTKIYDTVIMN